MANALRTIIIANGLILLIPGLNFALVSRIALIRGFMCSLKCASGITLAIMMHAICAIFGAHQLLEKNKFMFEGLKILGGFFVLYIAFKIIKNALGNNTNKIEESKLLFSSPFRQGFLIDILNPFIMFFYVGLFSQFINEQTKYFEILSYLGCVFLLTIIWFCLVSILFSRPRWQAFAFNYKKSIEIISGVALIYFGLKMLMA